MSLLGGSASEWRLHSNMIALGVQPLGIRPEQKVQIIRAVNCLKDAARDLDMSSAGDAGEEASKYLMRALAGERRFEAGDLRTMFGYIDRLLFTFAAEMRGTKMFVVQAAEAKYYGNEHLFGNDVATAFPTAAQDIADAGKCRALGQWTACVMHLMRALETPLTTLAAYCDVPSGNNWNKELNEIEQKLRSVQRSTDGAHAEQWASEAAAHLRNIKNAWRNHAQHGRARYNNEEAGAIWGNVRSFMQSAARQLRE